MCGTIIIYSLLRQGTDCNRSKHMANQFSVPLVSERYGTMQYVNFNGMRSKFPR